MSNLWYEKNISWNNKIYVWNDSCDIRLKDHGIWYNGNWRTTVFSLSPYKAREKIKMEHVAISSFALLFVMDETRSNGSRKTYLTKRMLLSWRPSGRKYFGKKKGEALVQEELWCTSPYTTHHQAATVMASYRDTCTGVMAANKLFLSLLVIPFRLLNLKFKVAQYSFQHLHLDGSL